MTSFILFFDGVSQAVPISGAVSLSAPLTRQPQRLPRCPRLASRKSVRDGNSVWDLAYPSGALRGRHRCMEVPRRQETRGLELDPPATDASAEDSCPAAERSAWEP